MAKIYAKECINAEDAILISKALDELRKKQEKEGSYEGDIISTRKSKDAIDFVLDRASLEYDEVCFCVSPGTKKRNK